MCETSTGLSSVANRSLLAFDKDSGYELVRRLYESMIPSSKSHMFDAPNVVALVVLSFSYQSVRDMGFFKTPDLGKYKTLKGWEVPTAPGTLSPTGDNRWSNRVSQRFTSAAVH